MRRRTVAAGAALTLAAAALTTELTLPSVAESRMREQLSTYGSVTRVDIVSSPAVMLLFGAVDSAEVTMGSVTIDPENMDQGLLDKAGDVERISAEIDTLRAGPLDVSSVVLTKDGETLDASATLDVDQIEKLAPGAQLVVKDGTLLFELAELPLPLPLPGPLQLKIGVEDGAVVARPVGAAAALLPTQRLVDRPGLSVKTFRSTITDGKVSIAATGSLADA